MATKILIVEDELNISQMIQDVLKFEGFDTETAFDGDEAIEKAHAAKPDLITLDIGLPKKTGLEVLQSLKNDTHSIAIPVIIVSAQSQQTDIDKGLSLGAARYMTKPCDPLKLVETIREILELPA